MRDLLRGVLAAGLLLAVPAVIAITIDHTGSKPAPAQKISTVAPEFTPTQSAECGKMLEKLNSGRWLVFSSTERNGDVLRVYVEPAFYLAKIQQKEELPPVLRCSEGGGIQMIRFLDSRSGKSVALWSSSTGFRTTE